MKRPILHSLVFALYFGLLALAGCSSPLAPAEPTLTATPDSSPTPTPTQTPTPLPGRMMVLAPSGMDPILFKQVTDLLKEQTAAAGMVLDVRNDLQPGDLTAEVRVAVLLAAPANLNDLLAAAPQVQFAVLSGGDLPEAGNLTAIRVQPQHQAFIAGYVATLLSDDWRAAGLIPGETADLQEAFANGGRYYCGVCAPGWPLSATFPLVKGAAAPGDGAAWAAAAQDLFDNGKAEVFYLSSAASQPEVYNYLAGRVQVANEVKVLGALPPPDALRAQWAATVGMDPAAALKQVLPDLMAGKSAGKLSVPVSLTDINPDVLSPGRLEQVKQLMADLDKGLIQTQSVPSQ